MSTGGLEDLSLEGLVRRYGLDARAEAALESLWTHLTDDPRAPTAVRDGALVLERHIADSLVGLELEPVRAARRVADLGSGAGLPGLVLAAALPTAEISAVESQQSKCAYVASLAGSARLENVRVVCTRAEQWEAGAEANDLVVARALAAQPVVLEYAAPLLELGGHLVEWRGSRDTAEEEELADGAAAQLGLERREVRSVLPFTTAERRNLHVFEKVAPTPRGFPRRVGLAVRRPLGR
jgi:16S rRNA (guanine527-N7)-methyltransferase